MSESETARWLAQRWAVRERRRRPHRLALTCAALGFASACLDPAISDEPPVSESTLALDGVDAGSPVVEQPAEATPAATWPRPARSDDARTRGSRRR